MMAFRSPLRGLASRAACAGIAIIAKITEIKMSLDIARYRAPTTGQPQMDALR
jgi:hypothetical protein